MKKTLNIVLSLLLILASVNFAQDAKTNKEAAMTKEAAKLYNQGNKQKRSGDTDGALASYNAALKAGPHSKIYYQMGLIYKKKRNYSKAEEMFNKSLEVNPNFNLAYNGLGTTYYKAGQYEKAVENFKKFAENAKKGINKKKAKKYIGLAYTKLGDEELKARNLDKAIEHLKNAVENYNYDAAYLKLADAYLSQGKYQLALEAANNAEKYRKKIPKGAPYYYKGLAYKGLHKVSQAKENFRIASKDKRYKAQSMHEIKYMN